MKFTIFTIAIFATAFGAPVRRQTGNVQTFTSALGGIAATPVEDSGNPSRPFQVKDDTFANIGAALARSCDQQFNACANAANEGDVTLSVAQCSTQKGVSPTDRLLTIARLTISQTSAVRVSKRVLQGRRATLRPMVLVMQTVQGTPVRTGTTLEMTTAILVGTLPQRVLQRYAHDQVDLDTGYRSSAVVK
ncbi:uncharacterized protein EKO05_0007768 [Ascochyta rabiei]|uniref:uncharacterized protein n=1 Tax=Didymella rabiei TaxID=5454 RepID=UPI002205A371|nr:uncharacterized protein EKO05_0007768 [Ascochyta rabiei]UPX17411.1 hypothetical protein EKO05_0007768 [Ascochyta rabiei]